MSLLRQGLYGVVLLLAAGVLIRVTTLERSAAAARVETAQAALHRSETALEVISQALVAERQAQARLRQDHDQLARLAAARKRLMEGLMDENTELANWAGRPLPDMARRLRQRPALTGAAAYRTWLSGSGAMLFEREPAPQ